MFTNEMFFKVLPLQVLQPLEEATAGGDGAGVGLLGIGAKLHDSCGSGSAYHAGATVHHWPLVVQGPQFVDW